MNIKHLSVGYKFMTRSIDERIYVVIMAGGEGTRFVPYSTPLKPKQFLPITFSDRTMIQETYERILSFSSPERCFVSTNSRYLPLVYEQLPLIPRENIIGEPLKKNTGPSAALITKILSLKDPEAIAVILPSDHFIERPDVLAQCLRKAANTADSLRKLITLGIKPTHPSTQYGYIKCSSKSMQDAFEVESFVEKPTKEKAERYIKDGGYYWNSGMFVWRPDVFLPLLETHAPQIAHSLEELRLEETSWNDESIFKYYEKVPSISIDYALMEKTNEIMMVPLDAGWHDVGGWDAVANLYSDGKINPPKEVLLYLKK